jgi:hypothetical protein
VFDSHPRRSAIDTPRIEQPAAAHVVERGIDYAQPSSTRILSTTRVDDVH